jgi:hypothetical protein
MENKKRYFRLPKHVKALLLQLGLVLLFLMLTRVVFYLANKDSFTEVSVKDFFISLWIDSITIALLFLPYYTLFLIPFYNRNNRFYKLFFRILFHITNSTLLIFNLIDVEYYQFTNKRSTFDLFTIVGAGNDITQLLSTFIKDFWWLILIFIVLHPLNPASNSFTSLTFTLGKVALIST